jgi:hypothetical protein
LLDSITEQVVGGLVLALILGAVTWLWRRRREQTGKTETNRHAMYSLVRFLENRRALYAGLGAEDEKTIIDSVRTIRSRLQEDIEELGEEFEDAPTLLKMQSACRDFLTVAEQPNPHLRSKTFEEALRSLMQVFDTEMDNLRDKYGIEPGPPPKDVNAS